MSELSKRILFGVPAALLFVYLAWLGGLYFELFLGIAAVGTVWEMDRILGKAGAPTYTILVWLLALFVWFFGRLPITVTWILLMAIIAGSVIMYVRRGNTSKRWFASLLVGIYAPLGMLMLFEIREAGAGLDGFWLTLAVIFMIWGSDVFAYFGGKTFGKRKLAPNISPNKTWEGFWSGLVGSLVGMMIVVAVAPVFPFTIGWMLPAVVLAGTFGPLGDLLESKLKRMADVKDSSTLFPGHGGFFDRLDALILSAPVLYLYFLLAWAWLG
ncbi:MAG: phosphatidate cytidylyltransferase [Balneolaceae bacterium]